VDYFIAYHLLTFPTADTMMADASTTCIRHHYFTNETRPCHKEKPGETAEDRYLTAGVSPRRLRINRALADPSLHSLAATLSAGCPCGSFRTGTSRFLPANVQKIAGVAVLSRLRNVP
jgi:hypothetical protein